MFCILIRVYFTCVTQGPVKRKRDSRPHQQAVTPSRHHRPSQLHDTPPRPNLPSLASSRPNLPSLAPSRPNLPPIAPSRPNLQPIAPSRPNLPPLSSVPDEDVTVPEDFTDGDVTVEDVPEPATSASPTTTSESPDSVQDDVLRQVMSTMAGLHGPEREIILMQIAKKIKVTIVGEEYSLTALIKAATAAKAAPTIHAVIADECIRLGVGRREYRRVVVRMYNKIRDAIGWVDKPGARFCPKWSRMKKRIHKELAKGPNKAVHTKEPEWPSGGTGCVWTEVEIYLAERLIAYRAELPVTYREHLKTISNRVAMVNDALPDVCAAIRVPIDLQDGTKLLLVVMADGALLYRRAKIKVAMSQTEVTATVLNEGITHTHTHTQSPPPSPSPVTLTS